MEYNTLSIEKSHQHNKVLRNTYLLLATSLLPTVFGAWLGVSLGILQLLGGVGSLLVFVIGAVGLFYMINKYKNSVLGVAMLLFFTFFMGVMSSATVGAVLGMQNGVTLVTTAFAGTAGVFFMMACLASMIKRDLSGMGPWLLVGVIILLVGTVVNIAIGSTVIASLISVVAIGLFSVFMLYDLKQIVDGGETNYVVATLSLYLDIFNVFQSTLELSSIFGGDE